MTTDENTSPQNQDEQIHDPSTPYTVVSTVADSDSITAVDLPEQPPADDVRFTPIPPEWLTVGVHPSLTRREARLYAITAEHRPEDDSIEIRYIHPVNIRAKHQRVDVNMTNGPVPASVYDAHVGDGSSDTSFKNSIGIGGLGPSAQSPAPTPPERKLLWALHGEYLLKNTLYRPRNQSD